MNSFARHFLLEWCALAVLMFPGFATGQETPADDIVVVPYDESRPLAEQSARSFYLDARTFEKLLSQAEQTRGREERASTESGYVLVEGLHDVEWRDGKLLAKARFRLHVSGSEWVRVPFAFAGAVVKTTLVNGAPAAYDKGDLLLKEPGWHAVEVDYQVPVDANGREAGWAVPPATAALIRIRGAKEAPVVNGGLPATVDHNGEEMVVTVALGNRGAVHLFLAGPVRTPAVERARLAKVESILTVRPGVHTLEATIDWEFPGSSLQSFAVDFDAKFTPVRLEIPNLETWRLVRGGQAGARLEFALTEPVAGGLTIGMTAESGPGGVEGDVAFPRVRPDASRLEETLVVASAGGVEVEVAGAEIGQRVAIPGRVREKAAGDRLVAAFSGNGEGRGLSLRVSQVVSRDTVRAGYVYQVGAAQLDVFVSGTLNLVDARRQFRIGLPKGAAVREFIPGNGVMSWWRSGDDLWLQCGPGAAADGIPFLLSYVIADPVIEAGKLALPELVWPENTVVGGDGLVLVHAAAEADLTFAVRERARLTEPATVLTEFAVLPPYRRSHAFHYEGTGVGVAVGLREVTPVFDADWVLSAVVNETWIQLAYHIDVEVTRSALRQLIVNVAAEVPELRWEGAALREVRSVVEARNRVYTLTFQEDVTDVATVVATTELPLVQGGARLPHLALPQARQQSHFAVLETRTRGGLETNLARVEEVPREILPYLPRKMNNPKFHRMIGPDWFLGVGLTRLENVGGLEMVITGSEIVTAIRENGEEWYHVSYRMRNQSLQFLPVKLEKGMDVIKVRVAAKEVQPKRGPADRKTETLLIPLDPTRTEELPFLVELVYRRPSSGAARLGNDFRRSLQAPELDLGGRSEAQTFWSLYLPPGYAGHKVAGAVNQIPWQQGSLALVESNVDELERLAQGARSGSQPAIAWQNVLALAALTREQSLPELQGYDKAGEVRPKLEGRIQALETEARAFRPGADLSMSVLVSASDLATVSGSGFAENSPAVAERNRRLMDGGRDRMESVRDLMKLSDFVAVRWALTPVEVTPVETVGEGAAEGFDFSSAQRETARRLLDSWNTAGPSRIVEVPRFSHAPPAAKVEDAAPGPRIESTESPRVVPDLDPESVRARLRPEVDFPTEGAPLVFHKLKGNARLEIAGYREGQGDLPAVWGWFIVCLVGLRGLAWLIGPRRHGGLRLES